MTACVVPTIRPDRMKWFKQVWDYLFRKHNVTLITVHDGDTHEVTVEQYGSDPGPPVTPRTDVPPDLIYHRTDSCRNLGFAYAAGMKCEYILTLDDDVAPPSSGDPIQDHIDTLNKRVCLSWMNTAHGDTPMLRGVPYDTRAEAPVMLSHGVWEGVPDWDGETQLRLEAVEKSTGTLPFYKGPVPRGVLFPLCGMNVMVRAAALRYFYYAPMGPDTKVPGLNRFGDIWMGVFIKLTFDRLGWACYTGGSSCYHTRASDAAKNFEQEKVGREWNERLWRVSTGVSRGTPYDPDDPFNKYLVSYYTKRQRWADLIDRLQK